MTPPAIDPRPGAVFGCYEVLACLSGPDVGVTSRQFAVRTTCCGRGLIRGYRALRESHHAGRSRCSRCQDRLRGAAMRTIQSGTRFGPVVIVAQCGSRFQVRWDCCGAVAEVSSPRLYTLRHEAKFGGKPRCRECYLASRGAVAGVPQPALATVALLPPGVVAAGLAWPRPPMSTIPVFE